VIGFTGPSGDPPPIGDGPADAEPVASGLALKRPKASVRYADTLNQDRQTAARLHGLGHHSCKLGEHKVGEHLGREATRYEQVLR